MSAPTDERPTWSIVLLLAALIARVAPPLVRALHEPPGVNPWITIVGARARGRLELADEPRAELARRGTRATGLVQAAPLGAGEIVGDPSDAATGARVPLAREPADPQMCNSGFAPEAFDAAAEWPADASFPGAGRVDATERGLGPAILSALREPARRVVVGPSAPAAPAPRLPDPPHVLELPAPEGFVVRAVRATGDRDELGPAVGSEAAA